MNLHFVKDAWSSSSILARVVVGLAVVIVLLFAAGAGAKGWEHFRGKRFDKRMAEREQQVHQLDARIAELTLRAERAEAKAALTEQKAETLEALNKQQGAKVKAEALKIEEAFAAYEKDSAITGSDVPDAVRRQRLCQKRKELGYRCSQ